MTERWHNVLWAVVGALASSAGLGLATQIWDTPRSRAVMEQRVSAQEKRVDELSGVAVTLERIETRLQDVVDRLKRVEAKQDEAPPERARKGK